MQNKYEARRNNLVSSCLKIKSAKIFEYSSVIRYLPMGHMVQSPVPSKFINSFHALIFLSYYITNQTSTLSDVPYGHVSLTLRSREQPGGSNWAVHLVLIRHCECCCKDQLGHTHLKGSGCWSKTV